MRWRILLGAIAAVLIAAAVVIAMLMIRADDRSAEHPVWDALERHDAELRAIPGVLSLGTVEPDAGEAAIVVYVAAVTPQIEAAVPDELDGFPVRVQVKPTPPPGPPTIEGLVDDVSAATSQQTADGVAGTVTLTGELYAQGPGTAAEIGRTLVVLVPDDCPIWRPQGEGKDFTDFAAIQVGRRCRVTLDAAPEEGAREATAVDVEIYRID